MELSGFAGQEINPRACNLSLVKTMTTISCLIAAVSEVPVSEEIQFSVRLLRLIIRCLAFVCGARN